MHTFQRIASCVGPVQFAVLVIVMMSVGADMIAQDDLGMPCRFLDSINITGGVFQEDGHILYKGTKFHPSQFGTYNYKISSPTTREWTAPHLRGCICNVSSSCVRLCCASDEYFLNGTCVVNTEHGLLSYDHPVQNRETGENDTVNLLEKFGVVHGKPCVTMYALSPLDYDDERYTLLDNGLMKFPNEESIDATNEVCMVYEKRTSSLDFTVYRCFTEVSDIKFAVYPFGMLISVPFLLVTFFVYALLPELQNLHGKNLMCYVFGLTMSYILMSSIHLFTESVNYVSAKLCEALGFSAYISFMISFFWLNVMCFDIWWTFRGVRGVVKEAERKKFILYSTYAWGCTLFILAFTLVANYTEMLPEAFRPGIGETGCWLKKRQLTEFIYLYAIVVILIFTNMVLFAVTSYKIRKLQLETAAITKGDSRRFNKMDADKDRFGLYLRLFIVMGVSWSTEIISWALDDHQTSIVFYITDILNCLQGLFIFGLFVWKPKIKALIIKRWRAHRGLSQPSSSRFRSSTQTNSTGYSRQSTTNNNSIYARNNSVLNNLNNNNNTSSIISKNAAEKSLIMSD